VFDRPESTWCSLGSAGGSRTSFVGIAGALALLALVTGRRRAR
jgi:MYXO-CTERM domain-containing protein